MLSRIAPPALPCVLSVALISSKSSHSRISMISLFGFMLISLRFNSIKVTSGNFFPLFLDWLMRFCQDDGGRLLIGIGARLEEGVQRILKMTEEVSNPSRFG